MHEYIEYFPYGETWVQETIGSESIPYKFTSKELDEETGLYYFGARYYDSRLSRWISTDPAVEKYLPVIQSKQSNNFIPENDLPGHGGVYRSININSYHYGGNNPVAFVDPDGEYDVVFVYTWKPQYKKFESTAMVYPNGTLTNLKLFSLKADYYFLGPLHGPWTVRATLGTPIREFNNFSTLPNDTTRYGTIKSGVLYNYQQGYFDSPSGRLYGFSLSDPNLGNRLVPQDPKYGGGINPAFPDRNPPYLSGTWIHVAGRGNPNNVGYNSLSIGCITGYGNFFSEFYNFLDSSPNGRNGNIIIFRMGWGFNY